MALVLVRKEISMLFKLGLAISLAATVSGVVGHAQEWEATRLAKGWSRFDATGAATFYDASSQRLITWMQDAGVLSTVDLAKAGMVPERWVVDDDRIWIMAGTTMKLISKTGQVQRTIDLPAEVGDVDFLPPNGIAISYRTPAPFIERRDIKSGSEVWTYGKKPRKGEYTSRARHRILRNDEMNLILVSGEEMVATLLDGKKGDALGQGMFTLNEAAPPRLVLGDRDRGAIAWWWSKSVAFAAVPASAVPALQQQGLLLVRMDFTASALEFLPTGVTEEFQLAGIVENRAVLVAPNGGLVFVSIK